MNADKTIEIYEVFKLSRNMSNIRRYNIRLKLKETNVAEHSYYVSLMSLLIADVFKEWNVKVDYEKLAFKALLHDLAECLLGDILIPTKTTIKKEYTKLSERLLSKKFKFYYKYTTNDSSLEDKIVLFADRLEGLYYCHEEMLLGNSSFKSIFFAYLNRIREIIAAAKGAEKKIFEDIYEVVVKRILEKIGGDINEF